jgi:hypothetical protein
MSITFRASIAPHTQPNKFAEESTFHLAALEAGVSYIVRISTTAANVRPDCKAYYPRNHWAIEAMLSSPEFKGLQWTSLQANIFSPFYLSPAVELIKHLLSQEDPAVHNNARYVLNGPKDITGNQIVKMIEERIGLQVEDVIYKDMSLIDQVAATTQESKNVILSVKYALETAWEGKCTASTTSKEVLELAPPKRTPADVLELLLKQLRSGPVDSYVDCTC